MASERPCLPPRVVIDANVLYPFHLRNLLIQFGVDSIITPRWTARINAEWIGNLAATGRVSEDRLVHTLDLMNSVLPEAEVQGWETRMGDLTLPDPDDRHVLAAALTSTAETILTKNLRDFPASALAPFGIVAVHPDAFMCKLFDGDPDLLRAAAGAAHANLSRSAPSFEAYLDVLANQGLPQFAERLRG
ncbi:PIN domain-containing protein [Lichenicoccus sp.]|uniref:PIN domain-containing protein n=1 Tax=Lichenicoccus sp. TaxID=2781899 RepID=UPI003D09B658